MKPKEIKKFRDSYTKYDKPCVFEGYKLAVLFDEKDDVKKYGGRWNAEGSHWWMPANKLLEECSPDQSLVRDWLNDNKMTMGPYGKFDENLNMGASTNIFRLVKHNGASHEEKINVHFYDKNDAVLFEPHKGDKSRWFTLEEARVAWDEFISSGYVRGEDVA